MKIARPFLKTSNFKIDLLGKGRVTTPKIDEKVEIWGYWIPLIQLPKVLKRQTPTKGFKPSEVFLSLSLPLYNSDLNSKVCHHTVVFCHVLASRFVNIH
jgi:hypothetical protein